MEDSLKSILPPLYVVNDAINFMNDHNYSMRRYMREEPTWHSVYIILSDVFEYMNTIWIWKKYGSSWLSDYDSGIDVTQYVMPYVQPDIDQNLLDAIDFFSRVDVDIMKAALDYFDDYEALCWWAIQDTGNNSSLFLSIAAAHKMRHHEAVYTGEKFYIHLG